jgi:hypothetical protein
LSRFPTIFELDDRLPDLFDARRVLMIELVQLGQGVLDLTITDHHLLIAA